MSIQCEYGGRIYTRSSSRWVDKDGFVAPVYIQNALNALAYNERDISEMSYGEAKLEGDKCKESESYSLAVKYYEQALNEASDILEMSVILPRVTSCYRRLNMPRRVIELLGDAKAAFGEEIINEALLTSAAAAYCDLGEPENAIRCCKWAYKMLRGRTEEFSIQLSNVYERAHKMLDPDYDREAALNEREKKWST